MAKSNEAVVRKTDSSHESFFVGKNTNEILQHIATLDLTDESVRSLTTKQLLTYIRTRNTPHDGIELVDTLFNTVENGVRDFARTFVSEEKNLFLGYIGCDDPMASDAAIILLVDVAFDSILHDDPDLIGDVTEHIEKVLHERGHEMLSSVHDSHTDFGLRVGVYGKITGYLDLPEDVREEYRPMAIAYIRRALEDGIHSGLHGHKFFYEQLDFHSIFRGAPIEVVESIVRTIANKMNITLDLNKDRYRDYRTGETNTQKYYGSVLKTLETLLKLESMHPGSINILQRMYGIKDFSRYSFEILLRQFEERNSTKPYGVVLSANYDHNGAFLGDKDILTALSRELAVHGYALRVAEYDSRTDFSSCFLRLHKRYGKEQPISFLIVQAHSARTHFVMGDSGNEKITTTDIEKLDFSRVEHLFVSSPQIIFTGCSSGKENGLAQTIHQESGFSTQGPDTDTSTSSIEVKWRDGKPILRALYVDTENPGDILERRTTDGVVYKKDAEK